MRSNSGKDFELAEEADPGSFRSERARRRAIGFDRWCGRHPVLITLLTGTVLGVLLWLALPDTRGERYTLRLIVYSVTVVGAMVMTARLALKARKKYH